MNFSVVFRAHGPVELVILDNTMLRGHAVVANGGWTTVEDRTGVLGILNNTVRHPSYVPMR